MSNQPPRDLLIELRFDKGMTREQIAEHFKVSYATVRRWIKDLNVPRPKKKEKPPKLAHLTSSGEIIVDLRDSYNDFEKARKFFEGRLVERINYGYYLDGRPMGADLIVIQYHKELSTI